MGMEDPFAKKLEGKLVMSPQMAESEVDKQRVRWDSLDGVTDFFDKKSEYFFKQMKSAEGDGDRDSMRDNYRHYTSLSEQIRTGNYDSALQSLEDLLSTNIDWDKPSKKTKYYGLDNEEMLRALAITLTKKVNEKRGEGSRRFSLPEQNTKFKELGNFLDEEIGLGIFDKEEERAVREALETRDYKYLAMTIDILIDGTNFKIKQVPQDKSIEEAVKNEARSRGIANTNMVAYLQYKLVKLRDYRQLLFEKSYLRKK